MQLKKVAQYTLLRKIGEGGFGEVFLAQNGVSYFALKLIPSNKSEREIKALESYLKLTKRDNANIVEILDWGTLNDYFYYVMPLADPMESSKSFAFEDVRWTEKSLSRLIEERSENPNAGWFSKDEISSTISNIIDAADFVNLIRNAEYVLTDSFHGSVFSILNHKQFVTFSRFADNTKNSRNSRISSLLKLLNLEERHFTNGDIVDIVRKKIYYDNIDLLLMKVKNYSFEYLKEALY